jgi:Tfp pilus assembly protein PilF
MTTIHIIILLSLALVALLVDWRKVMAKFPKKVSKQPKPRRSAAAAPAIPHEPVDMVMPLHPDLPKPKGKDRAERTGNAELDKLLEEADIHFRKGEMKAAEQLYLKVAAEAPRCSKAYSRLGVIYLENGEEWEDAEAAFRQALKSDPENGYVLNNLGLVLYHQDKFADAIRQFEQAVRQDDLNASRHANLGMAYMAMRQYAKAESSFKKALKLAPNELEYKDLLAEAVEKKLAHKSMVRR